MIASSFDTQTDALHALHANTVDPPRQHVALDARDLCKSFGTRQVVDRLSLQIEPGEIFGLLGPNGSGKTTTINLLCGLLRPTSGSVHILGFDVCLQSMQARRVLGVVPQETALYEELSAWANLAFHADLYGVPRREQQARITQMLSLVQLLPRKDARVSTFSGGMKRRLALARALLHEPQVLFLDEPTLGVDVQARRVLWAYIRALREQGRTILLTTNYLEEAHALCDRLAILDHGSVLAVATPALLQQLYGGSAIEVELAHSLPSLEAVHALEGVQAVQQVQTHLTLTVQDTHAVLPHLVTLLAQKNALRDLVVREASLDEIFLRLTGTALRD